MLLLSLLYIFHFSLYLNIQIAGIALNGIVTKSSKQCKFEDIQQLKDEKFKKILSLLYSINSKVNFFKEFDVDELFEVRILSVNPKFRGQGIAKHLLQQSEEIARENGFKVTLILLYYPHEAIILK